MGCERLSTALSSAQVKAQEWGFGWNAATGEYEDLLESGVIDPATVTQQAAPEVAEICLRGARDGGKVAELWAA